MTTGTRVPSARHPVRRDGQSIPTEERGGVTPDATVSRGLPASMQRRIATVNMVRVQPIP